MGQGHVSPGAEARLSEQPAGLIPLSPPPPPHQGSGEVPGEGLSPRGESL